MNSTLVYIVPVVAAILVGMGAYAFNKTYCGKDWAMIVQAIVIGALLAYVLYLYLSAKAASGASFF